MEKIREVFKRFFPLPASSADRRIKGLENSLRSISEAHKQLTSRLTLLLNGFSELVDQGRIAQEKLNELEENVQEIVSGDIFRRIEYCQMRLDEVGKNIQEVTHGDIFNRIVFTQNGIIRMENMYQRNMMRMEDQTGNEEFRFILRMRRLFTVASVISEKMFIRVGRHNYGGYVMLDDFESPVAYSIGIADDVSWDMDIASKGLDVYMYDHTIDELPEDNERFHFSRIGIGTKGDADNSSLRTLPEMMAENGHMNTYGMILKIDVEGAEWAVLQEIDEEILEHFSQIVFEFHGLTDMKKEEQIRSAMAKLNKTHQLVHLHANNYGTYRLLGGAILPDLLEGTYLLRSEYEFSGHPENVLTEQDEINCPYMADIYLGKWND